MRLNGSVLGEKQQTSLSQLVLKSTWAPAFEVIRHRIGTDYPATLVLITRTLVVIARDHLRSSPQVMNDLLLAKKKISKASGLDLFQMGARSRRILDQFETPANIARIVNLPDRLLRIAPTRRRTCEGALDAMVAGAVAILLNVPIRMKNLAEARLGKEIVRRPGKKGHCEFDVTYLAPKTKNTLAVDAVVTGKEARVLNTYIEKYRPFFATGEIAALFPDAQGATRPPDKLGALISKRITTITGLKMTPHAFRHLAAKIYLDHHPGDYEGARRILNHKKIETTIAFYCAFSSRKAQAEYHGLLDKYREGKQ